MNEIEKIIRKHQDEFNAMVMSFVMGKKNKQNKSPKTMYELCVMGKVYRNEKFVDTYKEFLRNILAVHSYDTISEALNGFVKRDPQELSPCSRDKGCVVMLKEDIFLSTYSSTEMKKNHIKKICDSLNLPHSFSKM